MLHASFAFAAQHRRMSPSEHFIARFLARVPREIGESFTCEQLHAVQRVFGMRYVTEHGVDIRRRVRLPWGRYYLVLLAGRDRRP